MIVPPPTAAEQRYLDRLLGALRGPCDEKFPTASQIVNQAFADEFRAALLFHHYFLQVPLETGAFESAFIRACIAAGHTTTRAADGYRFYDVEVDGKKISLKSTRAANVRPAFLHISKLCEAAWIQDMRSATQREANAKTLFESYTSSVDSIIQLRYFRKLEFYELVEIPSTILAQVKDVPRAAFAADGPTIGIPVGKTPPDFTLKLDRSDAKITLANINKNVCNVLGTWQLIK